MLHFGLFILCAVFSISNLKGETVEQSKYHVLELSGDYGQNITLPCFNNRSDVIIKWEKQGKEGKQVLQNGDLFLQNLQKKDTGVYKCSIDHEDSILSKIYLNVKTPPAAVDNVTVIPSTVLAFIHWNLKDDGGYPVTNISIRYKDELEKQWHYVNPHSISLTHTQAEIYKLNPNSTYIFQVWAANKLGYGEVANITARTLNDKQEIELARHLLDGAETFDTRIWLAAVAVVMTTLMILTIGTCYILYRDCQFPLRSGGSEDPEHIELIPNVILNPGYSEEMLWSEGISNEEKNELNEKKEVYVDSADDDDDDDDDNGDDFTIYFASRSDATAIKV